MPDTWVGVVNTTRPDYQRGQSDMTIRRRLRLAMLRRRGRIETNQSGEYCRWQLKYSKPDTQGYADGSSLDFTAHVAHKYIRVNWRGIISTDTLSLMSHAMNTGSNRLINLFQDKANNIMDAVREDFNANLINTDGEAAGSLSLPHGLETFLNSGTTVAADLVAKPDDTYGLDSISTVLANYGGSWSSDLTTSPNANVATDWPHGKGDREYDFNSPTLVNWSSDNWGTGTDTWEANCWRAISTGITWLGVNTGEAGTPDLVSLGKDLWQGYKNHHETVRRITVPHKEAQDLGFSKTTLNQDGVAIQAEFDIPANVGYIENLNTVTISSIMPDLLWLVHGYDQVGGALQGFLNAMDIRSLSMLMVGGFFGNAKYQPKHTGKLKNFAT